MITDNKIQYLAPEADVLELMTEGFIAVSGSGAPSFNGFNEEVDW